LSAGEAQESSEPGNGEPFLEIGVDVVQTKRMLSGPTETHVQSSQVNYSSQGSKINLTKKFDDAKSMSSLGRSEKLWQHKAPAEKEGGDPYIKIAVCQKKARNHNPGSTRKRSQHTYTKKSSA